MHFFQPGALLSQDLITLAPAPQHPRPQRAVAKHTQISPLDAEFDEKDPPFDPFSNRSARHSSHIRSASSPPNLSHQAHTPHSPRPARPYQPAFTSPAPLFASQAALASTHHARPLSTSSYTRPRGLRILKLIKSWMPLILYALTSLGFVVAITVYKTELFERTSGPER